MARARAKRNRKLTEIADTILAEWYRVLPETSGPAPLQMDAFALTAAFNEILDTSCQAIVDEPGQPIKIVVPLPPVDSRLSLDDYIRRNGDFAAGMGAAVIFGCGR
jgi:hypothetical protein